jgi:ribA/ribD-fused uncharacterized protein
MAQSGDYGTAVPSVVVAHRATPNCRLHVPPCALCAIFHLITHKTPKTETEKAMFKPSGEDAVSVSMTDASDPLASFSEHAVTLEDGEWPSVEHYFSAMMFTDAELRERIRAAPGPAQARRIAKQHKHSTRKDWGRIAETVMTRALYVKCRTHPDVLTALLATGGQPIIERSLYDYHWGCGRDGRGHNAYGKILMAVRERLQTANN